MEFLNQEVLKAFLKAHLDYDEFKRTKQINTMIII